MDDFRGQVSWEGRGMGEGKFFGVVTDGFYEVDPASPHADRWRRVSESYMTGCCACGPRDESPIHCIL